MANGIKIYYLPKLPVLNGDTSFFSVWHVYPILRQIIIREKIDICHGHQSTSLVSKEVMQVGKLLGCKCLFTEHSLFNYQDMASVNLNKILKWVFRDVDAAIAVSHACKDNFVLRTKVDPNICFTIPNAVNFQVFRPLGTRIPLRTEKDTINIVYISRLMYRKGVDLLIGIIPDIIKKYKNVNFIIGGDGDKMFLMKQLIQKYEIYDRIELLGGLTHKEVNETLNRGHIFLNTSLTESFCMAILEAAVCNMVVVTTNVGGVPEVLPKHMVYLSMPRVEDLFITACKAINEVRHKDASGFRDELFQLYSWPKVAEKTAKVYDFVMTKNTPNQLARIKT